MKDVSKTKYNELRKINGIYCEVWCLFTFIYALFIGLISGISYEVFPETGVMFGMPIDIRYAIIILALLLWTPLSILVKVLFTKGN